MTWKSHTAWMQKYDQIYKSEYAHNETEKSIRIFCIAGLKILTCF